MAGCVVTRLRRSQRSNRSAARLASLIVAVCCALFVALTPSIDFVAAAPTEKDRGVGTNSGVALRDSLSSSRDGLGAAASDIITITTANLAQTVKEGTWFVKFYTDWCTHCQRLQPTWEELATELKGKVNVGQINCDTERALCRRFHVSGYPTLIHVHNRRSRVYRKSRAKDTMVAFALKGYKTAPAISALKSPFGPLENFKALLVRASLHAKNLVMEELEKGTPIWVVCLATVSMLAVTTVIFAVAMVTSRRPKRD